MADRADPFDELASMFLTDIPAESDAAQEDAPPAVDHRAMIEIMLVGHLPVRAGLWLTPYADALARKQGPTALIRLDGDEPMIQVLRGGGTRSAR
jgi:hypothetical protein